SRDARARAAREAAARERAAVSPAMRWPSYLVRAAVVTATVACVWLTFAKLRVTSDLSTLFPANGDAAQLSRWTRAFGARDPAVILVRGGTPDDVATVADGIARELATAPSISRVV